MCTAYAFITIPHEILNGGTTSFSLVIHKIFGPDISLVVNIITILLLLLCYFFLGREYFKGALFSSVCYMGMFSVLETLHWSLPLPRFLCIPIAAILVGTGYAFCMWGKATALSFDTIALILHNKNKRINVARCIFIINVTVLLMGIIAYDWKAVLCGIIFSFLQSRVLWHLMDKLHF